MKFQVGDVVRLKSGGPHMTVREVGNDEVVCQWFVGGKHDSVSEAVFPVASLEKVAVK